MKKYILLYIIGFALIIGGSINLIFELDEFTFNSKPDKTYKYTETFELEEAMEYRFRNVEINDTYEDGVITIVVESLDDRVEDVTVIPYSWDYSEDERKIESYYFWVDYNRYNFSNSIEIIVNQIKDKNIYSEDYQFNNYKSTFIMNQATYDKYKLKH